MLKRWEKVISISTFGKKESMLQAKCYFFIHTLYILSQFEYCSLVWHFCSRDKMKNIEKIQKMLCDMYSMILMLAIVNCLGKLMYTHRLRRILSLVEKCIDGKCPMYLNDLVAVNPGSNYSRKLKMLVQPKYNSNK